MQHYAGIDVSLGLLSVCIVDAKGKIVKEAKVGSDPDTLVAFLRGLDLAIERIGLEAGPLSQWLHAGLTSAGFEAVLLETRHVKAALSAMTVKTDRKDTRNRPIDLDGLVSSGSLQIGWLARSPGPSCSAQTSAQQIARRGIQHPRHSTWVRSAKMGNGDAQEVRGAGPRIVC